MPYILKPTVAQTFLERIKTTPDVVGFQFKPTYAEAGVVGEWKRVTFRQFEGDARRVCFGLMSLGIAAGDKIAIISNTRYEWPVCDIGSMAALAVTVPVYASNTPDDIAYILNHCEAKVAFLENAKQLEKLVHLLNRDPQVLPHLKEIILIEPGGADAPFQAKNLRTLHALKNLGKREESKDPTRFERNLLAIKPRDLMTICYTSGTTGVPKGAMLTQDNMMSVLEDCVAAVGDHAEPEKEVVLSFLPFSHILGRCESMAVYTFGWKDCFAENLDKLTANIPEVGPTVIFGVPRIFEKVYNRVNAMVDSGGPAQRKLFDAAFKMGRKYFERVWARKQPSLRDRVVYKVAKKLVFRKVAQRFGGRLRFAICGGAPLPREIGEFFEIVGIKILEGYGLTETCAPVTLNLPEDARFGAVGKPLPEVQVKIADDGEILIKSRKVFEGYYKMPEETAEVLQNGWLHTGDIGEITSDGFVRITDRKKDLIVTSGGKNVAPQKIENLAKTFPVLNQLVVHGDKRNYLTALVTLDRELVVRFAQENQILFSGYPELIRHPKIQALVQRAIDGINEKLANYEQIKRFVVVPDEFTVESGELTPSLKVRRKIVGQKYRAEFDSMYT